MNKIKQFIQIVKIEPLKIISLLGLTFIYVLSCLYVPILIGEAINILVMKEIEFTILLQQLIIIAGIIGVVVISQYVLNISINKISYITGITLQKKLYKKIYDVKIQYIYTNLQGEIVSRITSDVDLVVNGMISSITSFFSGLIQIVLTIVIMLLIDIPIALVVIFLTPLSMLVAAIIVKRSHRYFQNEVALRGKMMAFVSERIENQQVINSFGFQHKNVEEFMVINDEVHQNGTLFQFYGALVNPTTRFINSLIYASVCLMASMAVIDGKFEVGILVTFLAYVGQYTKPFNEIAAVSSELQVTFVAIQRINELLNQPSKSYEGNHPIPRTIEKLSFDNVCMSYDTKQVINNLSLDIKANTTTAIVGKTGSGKTTLFNLLLRFYEQTSGKIKINETPIEEFSRKDLRSMFSIVLQDPWICSGTIEQNITLCNNTASRKEVIEVSKKLNIHEGILLLENGYDTKVEANDKRFSKGQMQLIALARILLSDSKILLFDEATSALDTRSEYVIQNALSYMTNNKTAIIIAHRLSTIVNADTIVVMEDGRIVEQGSHLELMKNKGYYYNLYKSQFTEEKTWQI